MSGLSTTTISEICATSSSAATRGITFLPKPVAGGEDVRIAAGLDDRHDGRREVLRGEAREVRRVGVQHLRDAGDLRGRLRRPLRAAAGDEHVNLAPDLLRSGHRVERRGLQRRAVVLGDQ